jgi:hypothetical protein
MVNGADFRFGLWRFGCFLDLRFEFFVEMRRLAGSSDEQTVPNNPREKVKVKRCIGAKKTAKVTVGEPGSELTMRSNDC